MKSSLSSRLKTGWMLGLLVSLFGGFLVPGLAEAASSDITITPTSNSPIINPGSVYHGTLEVIDQGNSSYPFLIYSTPYNVHGEDYSPDFTVLPNAPNVSGWLNFSSAGGNIKPGQVITIYYTISVPENTQPGGYYAAAFAETQFPKTSSGIVLNERVGELFYIQVAGPVVKEGSLVSWQSGFFQKPPLTSVVRVEDSGSIFFPATIKLAVKDILGHTKYSLTTTKELLPQTIRRITMPWSSAPAIGIFKVGGSVSYLNKTVNLPTKWVLVMSATVRVVVAIIVIVLIVLMLARLTFQKRRLEKRYKNRAKL